jgi:hypothetical protein
VRRVVTALFIGCTLLLAADTFTKRQRDFWSFQKVKEQTVDNFILAKLEAKGVKPGRPSDKGHAAAAGQRTAPGNYFPDRGFSASNHAYLLLRTISPM